MMTWLCVLFGTAVLVGGGYGGLKLFGHLAMKRDEAERERLAEQWKRRAAERRAKHEGAAPEGGEGDAPPLY
jgi:hypothetical protein